MRAGSYIGRWRRRSRRRVLSGARRSTTSGIWRRKGRIAATFRKQEKLQRQKERVSPLLFYWGRGTGFRGLILAGSMGGSQGPMGSRERAHNDGQLAEAKTCVRASRKGANGRIRKTQEVVVAQAYGIVVRASVKDDFEVLGQRFIHVDGQIVQRAERRHGTEFAIGEKRAELQLGGQTHRLADGRGQFVELHMPGARQNRQNRFIASLASAQHDGLSHLFAGDLHDRSHTLSGVRSRVSERFVGDLLAIQKRLQTRGNTHGRTPFAQDRQAEYRPARRGGKGIEPI